jgi:hypothetical protein
METERALLVDRPVPGFYKLRFVRGGPWVPVRIYMGQAPDPDDGELRGMHTMRAMVDGKDMDPLWAWTACAGHPIAEHDYRYMRAMTTHAKTFEPDMPEANPRQAVDWKNLRFDFGGKK